MLRFMLLKGLAVEHPSQQLLFRLQDVQRLCHAAVRWASSKGGSRKRNSKGYEGMLHDWNRSHAPRQQQQQMRRKQRAAGGSGSRPDPWGHTAAGFSFSSFNDSSSSRGRSRRRGQHDGRAFSKGFSHGVRSTIWSDINLAEAAAAAQLDPDELHNLVFSRDHPHSENSSGTINKRRRRAKRLTQQKKQAAKGRAAAAGGFGYAEFYWEDADASDADSDDEVLWHHYRASSTGGYNKQQWDPSHGPGRPDWQWWSEEQERLWFAEAWKKHGSQQGWQEQHRSSSSSSSQGSRPWWDHFQQQQQQQQQRQQQQHRRHQQEWQKWHQGGRQQQQSSCVHPQAVVDQLLLLGLPSNTVLQRSHLKAAFHRAAMAWHPDMHSDETAKVVAEAKFKQMKEAYEDLVRQAST